MSSAVCFNSDQSKILSSGNGLTLFQMANFGLVQMESIWRLQNNCEFKIEICFRKGGKHYGKRGKCWLPAFSPLHTMFSKGCFPGVVKSCDCAVKS